MINANKDSAVEAVVNRLAGRFQGDLLRPGDDDMIYVNKQHAAKLPFHRPRLLIRCKVLGDVRRAADILVERQIKFSVRGGGHCFADCSTACPAVLDLSGLTDVRLEGINAQLGGGVTAGTVSRELAKHGRALPTGGCMSVGVSGLAFAGGVGFSSRRLGLLADRLKAATVVLPGGGVITVDESHEPELLWALRGGGCLGFGISTSLTFSTADLTPGAACHAIWPLREAGEIIDVWQDWLTSGGNVAGLEVNLAMPDDLSEPGYVRLHGGVAGRPDDVEIYLKDLVKKPRSTFPRAPHLCSIPARSSPHASSENRPMTVQMRGSPVIPLNVSLTKPPARNSSPRGLRVKR